MDRIIVGNTTSTPYPRPDWNQPDENKADYIKNKPVVDQKYSSVSENAQSGKAVAEAISNLIDTAPETLNTLSELATDLGEDENFATTVTTELGEKENISNKITSISEDSTHEQYPSAKAVFDYVQAAINNLATLNDLVTE